VVLTAIFIFDRYTRAQYAMMLCSTIIVQEECSVLLRTVKVYSSYINYSVS